MYQATLGREDPANPNDFCQAIHRTCKTFQGKPIQKEVELVAERILIENTLQRGETSFCRVEEREKTSFLRYSTACCCFFVDSFFRGFGDLENIMKI